MLMGAARRPQVPLALMLEEHLLVPPALHLRLVLGGAPFDRWCNWEQLHPCGSGKTKP